MVNRIRRYLFLGFALVLVLAPHRAFAQGGGEEEDPSWLDAFVDALVAGIEVVFSPVLLIWDVVTSIFEYLVEFVYEGVVSALLDVLCFLISAFLTLFDPWIIELGELVQSAHVSHPGMYDFYEAAVVLNEWFPITWALMLAGLSLTVQLSLGALGWVLTAIPTMGR